MSTKNDKKKLIYKDLSCGIVGLAMKFIFYSQNWENKRVVL